MINNIKNYLKIGTILLAGALSYSGEKFETTSSENSLLYSSPNLEYAKMISNNYIANVDKSTPFEKARQEYETYKKSELEKILKEEEKLREYLEREKFSKANYLDPGSLNEFIKQAYSNVKKWPKEFDKRLFRIMLKQESQYDSHAVSKTGYRGLGQIGLEVIETFRPEEFVKIKNPNTGSIDTLALERYLFNPVNNLELSLENLDFASKFCAKYDKNWKNSDLETKRKKILFVYNAGVGTAKKYDFNPDTEINSKNEKLEKLPKENIEYPGTIMAAYYDPNIKVKL